MATAKKLSRQRRALKGLETTLKSGVKMLKDGVTQEKLSPSDIKRIEKEMESLKAKLLKG